MSPLRAAKVLLLLLLLGVPLAAFAQAAPQAGLGPAAVMGYLTAPSNADALEITLDYVHRNRPHLRLEADDLDDWVLTDRHVSRQNGTAHLHLRQRFRGIEVANADIGVAIDSEGRMVNLWNRFAPRLRESVNTGVPSISAIHAVTRAAEYLGLTLAEPLEYLETLGGPARKTQISRGGISQDEIPAKLMYLPQREGVVRLVWNLVIRPGDGQHWWDLYVDAVTGEVLSKHNWIAQESYRVYALPFESPAESLRTLEVDPADALGSPFGWHDTDGAVGAEFTDTTGNNVIAQEDTDGNDLAGDAPDGGPTLTFDFPLDLNLPPSTYQSAATTNLFYWTNILHDIHYQYGFDEASGNFQQNNYGNGGLGGDPVIADAQDGSIFNNANFGTPPDRVAPRMQMGVWALSLLTVNSPENISGNYPSRAALFGPALNLDGLTGGVIQGLDAPDPEGYSTTDACSPLTNGADVSGNIALIDRGDCLFVEKVRHAQDAGAIGAIIVNDAGDALVAMAGDDPTITIPSLFIRQSDGDTIKAELGSGVNVTFFGWLVDSDLDAGIIIHEYGHGVSTRLTGGPWNVTCLLDAFGLGLGEGWSDWWTLALTAKPGETGEQPRGIATFMVGLPHESAGIRRFPYSTDLAVNPLTFGDLEEAFLDGAPHSVGEIWAVTLWELYWKLVEIYGFDPDLYAGTGGNNLALQLVMDGLKLQPCYPSFLDARGAILSADLINNGGKNRCLLWEAFAKRGLGPNAQHLGVETPIGSPDFEVPDACDSRKQQRCINAMNKQMAKVAEAQGREIFKCIQDKAKARTAALIEECIVSDARFKVARARARTESAELTKCTGVVFHFGTTNANTMNNAAVQEEFNLIHDVFGSDLDASVVPEVDDRNVSKCQQVVAKSVRKCQDTTFNEFNKCKQMGLMGKEGPAGADLPFNDTRDLELCMGYDPSGKIQKACNTRLGRSIGRMCAGIDQPAAFPGTCYDAPDLRGCLDTRVECRVCLALNEADGLDRDCDEFCIGGGSPSGALLDLTGSLLECALTPSTPPPRTPRPAGAGRFTPSSSQGRPSRMEHERGGKVDHPSVFHIDHPLAGRV